MSYWRKYITQKINQAIFALPPDAPREELEKAIKNSWPQELGAKENFPYQVWLSAKNDFLAAYGFKKKSIKNKSKPKKKKPPTEVDGQQSLF